MLRDVRTLLIILLTSLCACHAVKDKPSISGSDIAVLWADMTLFVAKNTPANSPTFASRTLGYIGLTMYESIVNGYPKYRSLAGQLNGLPSLPRPDPDVQYNWPLCLNAGQSYIIKALYAQTSDAIKHKIDSLEEFINDGLAPAESNQEVVLRSTEYGRLVAKAIFDWSVTDGGHRGYLANFDSKLAMPTRQGSWKAPYFGQTINHFPLHPYWGNNRTFLSRDSTRSVSGFMPYDTASKSSYFKLFMDVYQANINMTQEQRQIALWWNDDPSETYTPPGHSYNLATIVIKKVKPDLIKTAQTYARVGMAVADAFIVCWRLKYIYFSERPSTFITENIDDEWEPFWPDPPFPAFPSGHATQASAVAEVLTDLYGEPFPFTDDSHVGRPQNLLRNIGYKARTFRSFREVAAETAYSRFLGGIHTAQDNEVGINEGKKIGQYVNELNWNR